MTALGLSVAAAMKREGPQAVPIIASVGEEVLSTRNGDAQFYRALKQRGAWSEMKVNNFADGGTVNPASSVSSVLRHIAVPLMKPSETRCSTMMLLSSCLWRYSRPNEPYRW